MEESLTGLDEVVVIGYGTMKRELTGAISSKGDEVNKMAIQILALLFQVSLLELVCDKAMLLQVKMLK